MTLALIKLALRNVLRNTRRSGLTLASVVIGLTSLFFLQSLMKSLQADMVERANSVFNSHLQVQSRESTDPKIPEIPLSGASWIGERLKEHPLIRLHSKRVLFTALAASAANSIGTGIIGVDPENEKQISSIAGYIRDGKYLDGPRQIIIGAIVARNLDIRAGEKLVVMAQSRNGALEGKSVRVAGIYETGSYTWDASICYMHRADAQEILGWEEDEFNSIAIKLKDATEIESVKKDLEKSLEISARGLKILTWKDVGSEIVHIKQFQDSVLYLIMIVIFIIVALGILNTMLMSLFERIREFGLMMALGAKRKQVALLLLAESAWLGLTGLLWGGLWGMGIIVFFHFVGMPLPLGQALSYFLPFEKTLHLRFAWGNHFVAVLCVILVSILAGLIPAIRVTRLKAAEALRHV